MRPFSLSIKRLILFSQLADNVASYQHKAKNAKSTCLVNCNSSMGIDENSILVHPLATALFLATASICSLISTAMIFPLGPIILCMALKLRPVPQHKSKTVSPSLSPPNNKAFLLCAVSLPSWYRFTMKSYLRHDRLYSSE